MGCRHPGAGTQAEGIPVGSWRGWPGLVGGDGEVSQSRALFVLGGPGGQGHSAGAGLPGLDPGSGLPRAVPSVRLPCLPRPVSSSVESASSPSVVPGT